MRSHSPWYTSWQTCKINLNVARDDDDDDNDDDDVVIYTLQVKTLKIQ